MQITNVFEFDEEIRLDEIWKKKKTKELVKAKTILGFFIYFFNFLFGIVIVILKESGNERLGINFAYTTTQWTRRVLFFHILLKNTVCTL